jgi:hypothetical protein
MSEQASSIGDHCAIFEFRNADIANNGTSNPVLVVSGSPPTPGMQMFIRPMSQDGKPEYWPYQVFYCFTALSPPPIQVVSILLQPDQVGTSGVQVAGDTLRVDLDVNFGSSE